MATNMPQKSKKAIAEMPMPTNVKELQSFLGVCNFLSKYSPRLAEFSDDLSQLTCKGIPYNWGLEHTEAFNALKEELTSAPVLWHHDTKKSLLLQMDASSKVLVQFCYKKVSLCTSLQKPCHHVSDPILHFS